MTSPDGLRRIYVSSNSFRDRRLDAILSVCDREGITGLELSALEQWDPRLLEKGCGRRYLVHNYCPPPVSPFLLNLASADPASLERSLAHCRRALDLSAELGGSVYAAHAGFAVDLEPRLLGDPHGQAQRVLGSLPAYEETYARLLASVKTLTAYAKARGVRFLIENHALSSTGGDAARRLLPMVTSDELLRLLADVDNEGFGVLVDVGHLNLSAHALGFDRVRFIETLAPFIGGFHLSDNAGVDDEHGSFGGDAWFLPFLRTCPDVPLTIELSQAPMSEILRTRDVVAGSL